MNFTNGVSSKGRLRRIFVLMCLVLPAFATDTLSIDLDMGTPGIQSTRAVLPGASFTIGLVLTVDAAGVSSYGVSALFDNTELGLNGSPAASELLPAGFAFNITPGVALESDPLGLVHTFEAATFDLGPVSTSFTIGTINFTALVPFTDGVADVTPGFLNTGIDGMFDNAGDAVIPIIEPGYIQAVLPEASHTALLFCGMLFVAVVRHRCQQARRDPLDRGVSLSPTPAARPSARS